MPPSQLKQLKASLHNSGILGQQKSKKQRKNSSKDAQKRLQRNAALEGIRERFNPFEAKAPARKEKFDIASSKPTKKTIERPGVTRGLGEERRRATLLKEMQTRNKVGGMLDRRFGEDDPNMTPEQKAAERFAQQALRTSRKNDLFNLEDGSDEELQLTHGGRVLGAGSTEQSLLRDDFDEQLSGSGDEDFDEQDDRPRKRQRLGEDMARSDEEEDGQSVRKKTKAEVMQEVMAKSKAYKAARQAQKEDDDDLRAELDQGLKDVFTDLVQGARRQKSQLPSPPITDAEPTLDPGRAALLAGKSRAEADKEYETNIRQLKIEARSKPSKRTKTEEEKAAEEKERLEELEKDRMRRMRGESLTSDEDAATSVKGVEEDQDEEYDDAGAFGLDQPEPKYIPNLAVEDEDEFVMDDIIASDSEAEPDTEDSGEETPDSAQEFSDDGDDDFINGLVLPSQTTTNTTPRPTTEKVPYTFGCPQTLEELIATTKDVESEAFPTIVQRIRALYHKGLAEGNNDKLATFAQILLPWVVIQIRNKSAKKTGLHTIEQLLRHLHSMAKAYPHEVASSFRQHLTSIVEKDCNLLDIGDLMALTAVGTIFPTSDLWHGVVSPSMLILARYLGQAAFESQIQLVRGLYACSLILRFQCQSQRYVPEAINFLSKAIQLLLPNRISNNIKLPTPNVLETFSGRIERKSPSPPGSLSFGMLFHDSNEKLSAENLVVAVMSLVEYCVYLYQGKSAWPEISAPLQQVIEGHILSKQNRLLLHETTISQAEKVLTALTSTREQSISSRTPLLLHNHRPLAIKSSFPLFDDQYNPTRKQRDPDAERAELNKLRAEHKKERKGAMRELRKDANFMAREQLRDKKAKDEAYEKKFRRLVAEIQSEEGHEAKSYERERAKRKSRF